MVSSMKSWIENALRTCTGNDIEPHMCPWGIKEDGSRGLLDSVNSFLNPCTASLHNHTAQQQHEICCTALFTVLNLIRPYYVSFLLPLLQNSHTGPCAPKGELKPLLPTPLAVILGNVNNYSSGVMTHTHTHVIFTQHNSNWCFALYYPVYGPALDIW